MFFKKASLLSALVLVAVPVLAQGPPEGGRAPIQTLITNAVADVDQAVLSIEGENFGSAPDVFFGTMGSLVRLLPLSASSTAILAPLPTTSPGTYLLIVQAGRGTTHTAAMSITLQGGDISAVVAGAGLAGGAGSGDAALSVATGGITSAMIADGAIVDADISASAAISPSKISGIVATLGVPGSPGSIAKFTSGTTIGSSVMTESGAGRVGVGTSNPQAKLDISGDLVVSQNVAIGAPSDPLRSLKVIGSGGKRPLKVETFDGSPADVNYRMASVGKEWFVGLNGDANFDFFDVQGGRHPLFLKQGSGNVGIGNLNPQARLDINGDLVVSQNVAIGAPSDPLRTLKVIGSGAKRALKVETFDGTPADINYRMASAGKEWFVGLLGDADFDFFDAQGSQHPLFLKQGTGNVGVGTTNPAERLHVIGNILATGAINAGSSRTLKDRITPLGDQEAQDAFNALAPIKFTYKADANSDLQLGFVAEDVPDLVATRDRTGIGSMDIIAVLTKVLQSQKQEIASLEARIRALERSGR